MVKVAVAVEEAVLAMELIRGNWVDVDAERIAIPVVASSVLSVVSVLSVWNVGEESEDFTGCFFAVGLRSAIVDDGSGQLLLSSVGGL